MIVRWKSVPVVFVPLPEDEEHVTGKDVRYVMNEVQTHELEIRRSSAWFGIHRLGLTLGYAVLVMGGFYLLFWVIPTWLQQVGLVSFHPQVPIPTMMGITVFASYVGAGYHLRDRIVRQETMQARGWDESKPFVWVPEEDWQSFVYDVQVHEQKWVVEA